MKLSPVAWVILLIGLIAVASGSVLVTLTINGTVKVISPALASTPTSLDWGTITIDPTLGGSGSQSLLIHNTGQLALTLTYSCTCPTGFSIALTPAPSSLAVGATWSGSAVLTVAGGTASNTYTPTLVITGS